MQLGFPFRRSPFPLSPFSRVRLLVRSGLNTLVFNYGITIVVLRREDCRGFCAGWEIVL